MLGPTLLFVLIVLTTRAFQAYGEIDILRLPSNPTVPGPQQVQSNINSDPEIADLHARTKDAPDDALYGERDPMPWGTSEPSSAR